MEITLIRDRVRELRRVRAGDLLTNPKNWRDHPERQRIALQKVFDEIGFAGAIIARELDDGRLMIIDGHARRDCAPDAIVPVLVLDVDERDADKLLAVLDPLSRMAEVNTVALDELLATVEIESEAIESLLADLQGRSADPGEGIPEANTPIDEGELAVTDTTCPSCGFAWKRSR